MKKVFTLVAVIALAASFTACKKERTCSCDGFDYEITSKKSVAKALCEGEGVEIAVDGETVDQEDTGCSLK